MMFTKFQKKTIYTVLHQYDGWRQEKTTRKKEQKNTSSKTGLNYAYKNKKKHS